MCVIEHASYAVHHFLHADSFGDIAEHPFDLDYADRLVDEEFDAGVICPLHDALVVDLGYHDKADVRPSLLDFFDQLDAVHAAHHEIHQYDIRLQTDDLIDCDQRISLGPCYFPEILVCDYIFEDISHRRIVIQYVVSH